MRVRVVADRFDPAGRARGRAAEAQADAVLRAAAHVPAEMHKALDVRTPSIHVALRTGRHAQARTAHRLTRQAWRNESA